MEFVLDVQVAANPGGEDSRAGITVAGDQVDDLHGFFPFFRANHAPAKLRASGERRTVRLRTWKILGKLRCCRWRAGKLAKAIHVLQPGAKSLCKSVADVTSKEAQNHQERSCAGA